MKCSIVHKALSAIDTAEEEGYINLDHRLVSRLDEMGLVSSYSTWFYEEMLASAADLDIARKRIVNAEEGSELRDQLKAKIKKLEAMPEPEGYKPTFDGNFVKLTEKGEFLNAHLSGRLPELEDLVLEDVNANLEVFQGRIEKLYSRFIGMLNRMQKGGFNREHNDVIDCAVRLSTISDTVQNLYDKMKIINDHFYTNYGHPTFSGYNRMIPVFAVTRQEGDIEMLREELTEMYKELVGRNFYSNFFTWWLASAVMELGKVGRKDDIKCFLEVRAALANKGWPKSQRHTAYMAASLARRHDSGEELAREHNTIYEKLAKTGRDKGANLGTASLILLDGEGTLEERAERFTETFEGMLDKGWKKHVYFYPAAAAISVMPGSIEENLLLLDRIVARLKRDGFEDKSQRWEGHKDGLTYKALDILRAAYTGEFRQEVTPSIIAHSNDSLFN